MAFVFRFKVLMQHRQYLLKKAQTDLAAAQSRFETIRIRRDAIKDQIVKQRQFWEERQAKGMHVSDFLSFRDYLKSLEQQLLTTEGELRKAAHEIANSQKIVIEKERDMKAMESLEEKERIDYQYEQTKKEQRQIDEIAIFKDAHKTN